MLSGEKMMLISGIVFVLCIFFTWLFIPEEDLYVSPSLRTEELIVRAPHEQVGKLDTSLAQFRGRQYDSVFVYSLGNILAFSGIASSKDWYYQESVGMIFQKVDVIHIDNKKRKVTVTISRDWVGASTVGLVGSVVIGLIITTIGVAFMRVK